MQDSPSGAVAALRRTLASWLSAPEADSRRATLPTVILFLAQALIV